MSGAKKHISYESVLNIIFLLLFFSAMLTFIALIPLYFVGDNMDRTCIPIEDNWFYRDEYGNNHRIINDQVDAEEGEPVTFGNDLPQTVQDGYYIAILSSRDISVYIDGELRKEFSLDSKPLKGGSVKNIYLFVPLTKADSGKEFLVVKHNDDRYNGYVSNTYVGSSIGIVLAQFRRLGNVFVFNLFFVNFSVICILGGTLYSLIFKRNLSFTQLVFALFFVGGWLAFDSEIFQFVFEIKILDGIMSYIFALMVPYPIMIYLNRITGKRYQKYFLSLGLISIISLVFFSVLHFTGVGYYGGNIGWIDASIAIICSLALVVLLYDFFIKKNRDYKYFMIGMLIFSAFGAGEMIAINFLSPTVDGYLVVTGLYFLIILSIIQQISELNRMEREKAKALEANESKSRFLASMSHELRTPINSIIGMDEFIIRECNEPKILEYASYIKSASNNLLGIVNDILDLSKIEAGKLDLIEDDYSLADVVNELSVLLLERALDKGLQTKINISPELPSGLHGDALHVKQIIINILSNAIKYTKSGTVSFYVSSEKSDVNNICVLKFIVSDTGIGIKEENIPKLFDYYSRLDSVKNHEIEGTGLGLNIVKQLLDSMNGSIKVESDYGFGSTFTMLIPQKIVDSAPIRNVFSNKPVAAKNDYKQSFKAENATILVVDDNNINLLIVKKLLENTLINVDTVESGYEALRLAANVKYDLILLDHMMPQIDGIEVLHKLRSDERSSSKDTPAIVLTANAVNGMREMYLNEGFSDYITKPIEPSLLEECISKWLPNEKVQKEI